ncbi:MAG: pathogenicity locus [Bacteroidetes bacterium]|nr:pathogenicity locus [Bacteroidota bacterium]
MEDLLSFKQFTSTLKEATIKELCQIPGVGKSIANDLWNIGIYGIKDLVGKDPAVLYNQSNLFAGCVQDRCLLYVFKCAVYYANTPADKRDAEKLKWWNWN